MATPAPAVAEMLLLWGLPGPLQPPPCWGCCCRGDATCWAPAPRSHSSLSFSSHPTPFPCPLPRAPPPFPVSSAPLQALTALRKRAGTRSQAAVHSCRATTRSSYSPPQEKWLHPPRPRSLHRPRVPPPWLSSANAPLHPPKLCPCCLSCALNEAGVSWRK